MIKTIILEDEKDAADALRAYLSQYSAEKGVAFGVRSYDNAVDLLEAYDASADVVFADIQMPLIDGMSAAKKIRDRDKSVLIVFVTNLAQYAIEGYEVGAFDFILKPVRRTSFFMKLDRIINELGHRRSHGMINLHARRHTPHSRFGYSVRRGHEPRRRSAYLVGREHTHAHDSVRAGG